MRPAAHRAWLIESPSPSARTDPKLKHSACDTPAIHRWRTRSKGRGDAWSLLWESRERADPEGLGEDQGRLVDKQESKGREPDKGEGVRAK